MEPLTKKRRQEKPPSFGVRLNVAGGDAKIAKVYTSLRSLFAKQEALQGGRSDCHAIWSPPNTFAVVVESKSKVIHTFGMMKGPHRVLELEEVLYLFERGTLFAESPTKHQWTIQDIYAALSIPLGAYIVYSRLRRAGYHLHRPPILSSIQNIDAALAIALRSVETTISLTPNASSSLAPPSDASVPTTPPSSSLVSASQDSQDIEMTSDPQWSNMLRARVGEFRWVMSDSPQELHVLDPDAAVDMGKLAAWSEANSIIALVEGSEIGFFALEKYMPRQP